MKAQITKIQANKFLINNIIYDFIKPNFLMYKFGLLIKAKVKGSTLGWYVQGCWVSYNTIKKLNNK